MTGGFSPFDCEITSVLKDGGNFVILSVNNTQLADGLPALQTDWWNHDGLNRNVSIVDVPTQLSTIRTSTSAAQLPH